MSGYMVKCLDQLTGDVLGPITKSENTSDRKNILSALAKYNWQATWLKHYLLVVERQLDSLNSRFKCIETL